MRMTSDIRNNNNNNLITFRNRCDFYQMRPSPAIVILFGRALAHWLDTKPLMTTTRTSGWWRKLRIHPIVYFIAWVKEQPWKERNSSLAVCRSLETGRTHQNIINDAEAHRTDHHNRDCTNWVVVHSFNNLRIYGHSVNIPAYTTHAHGNEVSRFRLIEPKLNHRIKNRYSMSTPALIFIFWQMVINLPFPMS